MAIRGTGLNDDLLGRLFRLISVSLWHQFVEAIGFTVGDLAAEPRIFRIQYSNRRSLGASGARKMKEKKAHKLLANAHGMFETGRCLGRSAMLLRCGGGLIFKIPRNGTGFVYEIPNQFSSH